MAKAHDYLIKRNTAVIVSDSTTVLGHGDIGPEAAMLAMTGKAVLNQKTAGVDGFRICLVTKDLGEIIETVERLALNIGGTKLKKRRTDALRHQELAQGALHHPGVLRRSLRQVAGDPCRFHQQPEADRQEAGELADRDLHHGAAGLVIGKILHNAGYGELIGVDSTGSI